METLEKKYPLLDNINSPADLKKLDVEQLPQLCDELRSFIINLSGRIRLDNFKPSSLGIAPPTVTIEIGKSKYASTLAFLISFSQTLVCFTRLNPF